MRIVVLNDGETWTTAVGCKIIETTDEEIELAMDEDRVPEGRTVGVFDNTGALR